MINVYVDSREKGAADSRGSRARRAKEYLEKKEGVKAQIINLEFGDYLFVKDNTRVCFEYKTIADYMNSLYNGSLFEETYNQSVEYDYSYVIVEGDLNDYVKQNNYLVHDALKFVKEFTGSLCRLRTFCNVIIVKNEMEAFTTMLKQVEKCFDFKVYGGCKRSLPSNDIVNYILSGCNGISHRIIKNIRQQLPHVTNLEGLLECDIEDFKSVDKIGEKKAVDIYEWLHGG